MLGHLRLKRSISYLSTMALGPDTTTVFFLRGKLWTKKGGVQLFNHSKRQLEHRMEPSPSPPWMILELWDQLWVTINPPRLEVYWVYHTGFSTVSSRCEKSGDQPNSHFHKQMVAVQRYPPGIQVLMSQGLQSPWQHIGGQEITHPELWQTDTSIA